MLLTWGAASNSSAASQGPSDPHFASTVFLGFQGEDGATESDDQSAAANGSPVFHNNAQIDTAQTPFGLGSALMLDGTDKAVLADNDDWLFPGDHTIDGWVRFRDVAGFKTLIAQADGSGNGYLLDWVNGGILRWRFQVGGWGQQNYQKNQEYAVDTWHHWAIMRSGDDFQMFLNGTPLEKFTIDGAGVNEARDLTFGSVTASDSTTGNGLDGWLYDVRITKGVARYEIDTPFDVPTEPVPRR